MPGPEDPVTYHTLTLPPRRKLSPDAPREWLRQGWDYFARTQRTSLVYGGSFAIAGMVITWFGLDRPQLILTFWTGFLLIGPLLAIGLFRIAQLMDRSETVHLSNCLQLLNKNLGSVVLFVLLLSLVMIAWVRFSTLAATLYIGDAASFAATIGTPQGIGFLALLFSVGAIFAIVLFALTAWSLPLVLDARTDFGTAVVASVKAVLEQPLPMVIWGVILSVLTLLGMLTCFIGFAVIFPWLGYASWAAYKDLFGRD